MEDLFGSDDEIESDISEDTIAANCIFAELLRIKPTVKKVQFTVLIFVIGVIISYHLHRHILMATLSCIAESLLLAMKTVIS